LFGGVGDLWYVFLIVVDVVGFVAGSGAKLRVYNNRSDETRCGLD
jgi:hypothetical protein